MSTTSSRFEAYLNEVLSNQEKTLIDKTHFVLSIFDETKGPEILYNDSLLDHQALLHLNLKMFSFLMGGVDYGPTNTAKIRGIVQIPKTSNYALAIDLLVNKTNPMDNEILKVPLVVFLIFPETYMSFYAMISKELEDYFYRNFRKGLTKIPSKQIIRALINKIKLQLVSFLNRKNIDIEGFFEYKS
ncbi:MAG: hypothetical protein KAS95_06520 [Candidatus Heimdallarchaeota archaeon]|nr:hypothetical protein [Candidatus Heimdallarchaeota archaeon]